MPSHIAEPPCCFYLILLFVFSFIHVDGRHNRPSYEALLNVFSGKSILQFFKWIDQLFFEQYKLL